MRLSVARPSRPFPSPRGDSRAAPGSPLRGPCSFPDLADATRAENCSTASIAPCCRTSAARAGLRQRHPEFPPSSSTTYPLTPSSTGQSVVVGMVTVVGHSTLPCPALPCPAPFPVRAEPPAVPFRRPRPPLPVVLGRRSRLSVSLIRSSPCACCFLLPPPTPPLICS